VINSHFFSILKAVKQFKEKTLKLYIMALSDCSNIKTVNEKAKKLENRTVKPSTRKDKKYMVVDDTGKYIHFGQLR
jgi:hypothetical protein